MKNRIFQFPAIALIVTILLTAASPTAEAIGKPIHQAPHITGPVHTSGTDIIDAAGNKVRILGVNSSGMERGEGNEWNAKDVSPDHHFWATPEELGCPQSYDVTAKAGFNTVRLNISWFSLERNKPTKDAKGKIVHDWNTKFITSLDHVVNEYTKHGVAVILCMYQWHWSPLFRDPDYFEHGSGMPFWLYPDKKVSQKDAEEQFAFDKNPIFDGYTQQDGFLDAWKMVATHFKGNNKIIAAEIINEPPHHDGWKLKEMYERFGHAIQSINPKWAIVVDQCHKEEGLPKKPNLSNMIYSIHIHPPGWDKGKDDRPSGKESISKELAKSRSWNVPFYINDFTKFGGKDDFEPNMSAMMRYCKQNNINWTYFTLQPVRKTSLIKKDNKTTVDDLIKVLQAGF